jgi:hypothetical protein
MKYKTGDKVKIKSFDWYIANECGGLVECDGIIFHERMIKLCGKELTIDLVYTNDEGTSLYIMKEPETQWRFTDSMIEGLADEEVAPQEKMVSLDKVCDTLYDMLHDQWINDGAMVGTWAYENMVDFVGDFCKRLEE